MKSLDYFYRRERKCRLDFDCYHFSPLYNARLSGEIFSDNAMLDHVSLMTDGDANPGISLERHRSNGFMNDSPIPSLISQNRTLDR